jgi:hypothetical protein
VFLVVGLVISVVVALLLPPIGRAPAGLIFGASIFVVVALVALTPATDRHVLTIGPTEVGYAERHHALASSWQNVASIEERHFWHDRGPVLVLHDDSLVEGDPGALGSLFGTATYARPEGRRIPLAPFADRPFRGSWLEEELRRHIPDLVDDYLERHPG